MTQLSVVIITFNEERNISRCINSVKDIADDIVVVDSYSTDQTKTICTHLGVRFIEHAFEGHIEQKNWAITQALYPHILSLDADEAIDEKLKKELLTVKANWQFDGYEMNRLTNYCGKFIYHSGWYPDRKLRLWDSRKGRWGGTNPHDRYELISPNSSSGYLKGNILHYSFYTTAEHDKQAAKFASIAASAMFHQGKKASRLTILLSPIARFFSSYILQLGFLDGKAGFRIAWVSARYTFQKYTQLKQLQKTAN